MKDKHETEMVTCQAEQKYLLYFYDQYAIKLFMDTRNETDTN